LGLSNGAGLANNLYIENSNPGLDIICAAVSHMNEFQYHLGNFYKIGTNTDSSISFCGYNQVSNPTNGNITISVDNFNGNIQTEVFDIIGNRLQISNKTNISLRDYAKGIYTLKVAYGDSSKEVKVIKE